MATHGLTFMVEVKGYEDLGNQPIKSLVINISLISGSFKQELK